MTVLGEKVCKKCRLPKLYSDFSPDASRRDGHFPWCRRCKANYQKPYREALPTEAKSAYNARWRSVRDANAEARAKYLSYTTLYSLKRRYGITVYDVLTVAEAQGGVCAICKDPPKKGRRGGLHVDHDHDTGQFRGLLCEACNQGLGRFRDKPELLHQAAKYLTAPPVSQIRSD